MSDRLKLDNEAARRLLGTPKIRNNLAVPTTTSGSEFDDRVRDTFENPMEDEGQIIYGGEHGVLLALGPGTENQVLTIEDVGGTLLPRWSDPTGGGGSIEILDEDSSIIATATALNFKGTGVVASDAGSGVAEITIPGSPSTTDDLAEGSTNLYFSVERAQDAMSTAFVDTSSIDITYVDGSDQFQWSVRPFSVAPQWSISEAGVVSVAAKQALYFPFNCSIVGWYCIADHIGDLTLDLWKNSHANWPLGNGDSIVAAAKPVLVGASKGSSTSLTGWTTSISSGEWIQLEVEYADVITAFTFALEIARNIP